ncbi:invasion associated locus B family protein [Magnetospirillum sp. SS-4]|uniref:invasion associated locus B family protein n=1 Tax=Magnetospirillum sp. SS-4 TaxID=2681465 RepID=UPI001573D3B7|nr:invasion associated locus B family protein [Magnetospirillum sp. SS-4]
MTCTALLAAIFTTNGASAAQPLKPGAAFDDWVVECEKAGDKQKCFISQTLNVKDSKGRLIKASIGYLGQNNEPTIVTLLPLGIWLPAGAAFKVGDMPQGSMLIQQCTQQGCVATAQLKPEHIKALSAGKTLNFGIQPAGSQETLVVGVSIKGLAAGLSALK